MGASAQLKTQTQAQTHSCSRHLPPIPKRRHHRRLETTISTTSLLSPTPVVTTDGPWCCAPSTRRPCTTQQPHSQLSSPSPPSSSSPLPDRDDSLPGFASCDSSPVRAGGGSGFAFSPLMDGTTNGAAAVPPPSTTAAFAPYPASYSKFNSALNAGLLNPMSPPPLDKTIRSSPTLFEMMANEQDCQNPRPTTAINAGPPPPLPPSSVMGGGGGRQHPSMQALTPQERQLLLQERVADIVGSCSPGNQLNDPDTSDVRLTLTSKDGLSVSMNVHRQILVAHSRFFAAKLSDRWSKQQRSLPHLVEISDCDEVEIYVETLRLMYCRDLRRRLLREDVPKVLAILKVSVAIAFDAGVLSCLEYLEAAPWAEDEEEKVAALLSQLRLESSGAGEVLKRVSMEVGPSSTSASAAADDMGNGNGVGNGNSGSEEILLRLLHVVLEGKDEKARREMKGLVSKMLRESNRNGGGVIAQNNDLSKESLYSACNSCLGILHHYFLRAAMSDLTEAGQIARQADNLHWLLDILIDRLAADEFLQTWASQTELAQMHPRVPAVHRYEVSRITSRLFVGIGKGQILVSKDARCLLLRTWLEPFYEDFGWMRRACKGLDRHLIEDGLGNTILTLPLAMQQDILLAWFDRFLNSGDDCPNIQRGFEVWWRRAFWRRHGEPERPPQLRIAASLDN